MNLQKAIKIKIQWRNDNYPPLADEMDADMLSIEALKRLDTLRTFNIGAAIDLLPGETKE